MLSFINYDLVCIFTLMCDLIDTQEVKPSDFSVQTVAVHSNSSMIDDDRLLFKPL